LSPVPKNGSPSFEQKGLSHWKGRGSNEDQPDNEENDATEGNAKDKLFNGRLFDLWLVVQLTLVEWLQLALVTPQRRSEL